MRIFSWVFVSAARSPHTATLSGKRERPDRFIVMATRKLPPPCSGARDFLPEFFPEMPPRMASLFRVSHGFLLRAAFTGRRLRQILMRGALLAVVLEFLKRHLAVAILVEQLEVFFCLGRALLADRTGFEFLKSE